MPAASSRSSNSLVDTQTFETSNLQLAVWLIVENHLIYKGARPVGRRATFVFSDPEDKGSLLQSQWLGSDPLLPQRLAHEVLRTLRSEIVTATDGAR